MKVLQINTTVNTTSTGRITEEIGQTLLRSGHESYIASAIIGPEGSSSNFIQIGDTFDIYMHGIKTRLFDRHGFGSRNATLKLIQEIKRIDPDVIGLHNLHGYYLNIELLFSYLKEAQKPILWTFHDCWPFTGHCSFFDFVSCERWKRECHHCPLSDKYPASWMIDNSRDNFHRKRDLFNGLQNMTIVTPSSWLKKLVGQSFLSLYPVEVIPNGIDLDQFRPVDATLVKATYGLSGKNIILGVASVWDRRKGFNYFLELGARLDNRFRIVLIGVSESQAKGLPDNIVPIPRTEHLNELASFYSAADVFLNPTLVDNFPTTNIEALACGTPVITFDTGGSPESITNETGMVVEQKNDEQLYQAVINVVEKGKIFYQKNCRQRAVENYNKDDRFKEYVRLYKKTSDTDRKLEPIQAERA